MELENFKELSKWVIVNNKLLQTLLVLKVGANGTEKILNQLINETEREFEEIEKENKENENIK